MFHEHAKETLNTAKQSAVYHVRAMITTIFPRILQIKLLRQIEIELNGAHLPLAANRILDLQVDLGTIESTAAGIDLIRNRLGLQRLFQRFGGLLPASLLAHGFVRAGREIRRHIIKSKCLQHVQRKGDRGLDLILNLFRRAENVGIILGKATHPQQSMQNAALLIAIYRTQLSPAQGELAIRTLVSLIDLYMEGAIHGLHEVIVPINIHGGVHILFIEIEMPGGLPQLCATNMRRIEQLVARAIMLATPEILNNSTNPSAARMPVHKPRTHILLDAE